MATVEEILDRQRVDPAFSWRPSAAGPPPSELSYSRPGDAYTYGPFKEQYREVAPDNVRSYGPRQDALLENQDGTNHVPYSNGFGADGNWATSGIDAANRSGKPQLLETVAAVKLNATTNAGSNASINCGTFTGSSEATQVFLEEGTGQYSQVGLRNQATNTWVWRVEIDHRNGTTTVVNGSADGVNLRRVRKLGVFGNDVWHLTVRTAFSNSENTSGEQRDLFVYPDPQDSGEMTIYHHAQHEERVSGGSIVPTTGSVRTRSGYSTLRLQVGDWYNSQAMTFYLEGMIPSFNYSNKFGNNQVNILKLEPSDNVVLECNNPSNGFFAINDGTKKCRTASSIPIQYKYFKVATSFNQNSLDIAANGGQAKTVSHDGTFFGNRPNKVILNTGSAMVLRDLQLIPRHFTKSDLKIKTSQ